METAMQQLEGTEDTAAPMTREQKQELVEITDSEEDFEGSTEVNCQICGEWNIEGGHRQGWCCPNDGNAIVDTTKDNEAPQLVDDESTTCEETSNDTNWEDDNSETAFLFEEEGTGGNQGHGIVAAFHDTPQARYVRFASVMESGSSDHVLGPHMFPQVPVRPSEGSRRGQVYAAAGGKSIANEGEQHLALLNNERAPAPLVYQVADVRKPLTSIARLCDRGNRIVFGKGGGIIQNLKNGTCTPFRREGSIYYLDLWHDTQAPFQRQG